MLQYLVILLDDTSVSYCHYENPSAKRNLLDLDVLKRGIMYAMKENLNVQFVYPTYNLPSEYEKVIESIDHIKIKPQHHSEGADVVVLTDWADGIECAVSEEIAYVMRATRMELKEHLDVLKILLSHVLRLNVVLTDVEKFKDEESGGYQELLSELNSCLVTQYLRGRVVQFNLLTDRTMLKQMNNCNAGVDNITLAPNGKFYLCPAFYYEDSANSVGNIESGIDIKNRQLLRLDHAPICRHCDAFQCKRCIWMNGRLTMDYNTPSHQQCLVAHLERNASRMLQQDLCEKGFRLNDVPEINEINYLDPFNNYKQWK